MGKCCHFGDYSLVHLTSWLALGSICFILAMQRWVSSQIIEAILVVRDHKRLLTFYFKGFVIIEIIMTRPSGIIKITTVETLEIEQFVQFYLGTYYNSHYIKLIHHYGLGSTKIKVKNAIFQNDLKPFFLFSVCKVLKQKMVCQLLALQSSFL